MKKVIFLFLTLSSLVTAQVTQQWMATYNGPSGSIDSVRNLVTDNEGNVYVTGSSTSSTLWDYTTLKYNSSGVLQWEARYDGPNHFRDDAQWVAVDNSGNVYVTGSSRSRVLAGSEDFATVKYNSSGIQQWSALYDGPESSVDVAVKIAVDKSGNVYVTGYSYGGGIDYATIKYNSAGVQQWVARYNGPGNSLDAPTALAVDTLGNVFVTGWSRSTPLYGSEDYLTVKYDMNGIEQWVVRHDGPANWNDAAISIAIDKAGNIYVTGYCYAEPSKADYVTIKYNTNGVQQWAATYNNGAVSGSDMARMVVVDNSGNVYVTGESNTEYPYGYPDYATIKYNSSGIQQWASRYNGAGNGVDVPYSLALDNLGNVYVTGKVTAPGFLSDFATVKYNSNGNQIWEKKFDGASNLHDGATSINVDNFGNVYVAGNSMYHTNFASDYVILKYSQLVNPVLMLSVNYEMYNAEDAITVELRNATSPFALVESKTGLGGQGTAHQIQFTNAVNGTPYYIVVKQRNSIETWSKFGGEVFTNGTLTYNFTIAESQAFGNNMISVNGKYSFYAGDVNQDGIVDAADLSMVDNDVLNLLSGYVVTDLNADNIVDASDLSIADNNVFNGVLVRNPIVGVPGSPEPMEPKIK